MKTLQDDFTTPEQSKRLLELGLPADSADCYLQRRFGTDQWSEEKQFIPHDKLYSQWCTSRIQLPCWSVGRLIEIMVLCDTNSRWNLITPSAGASLTDWCMEAIEVALTEGDIDFSKLEE